MAEILERLSQGGSVDHLETVRVTKDRRRIHVSLTIFPIKDQQGVTIGASTIARDITERKRARAARVAAAQRDDSPLPRDDARRICLVAGDELSRSAPFSAIPRRRNFFYKTQLLEEIRVILEDIRKDDQRAGAVIDRMRSLLKRRELEFSMVRLERIGW